jgi:hypothetical protein
MCGRYTLTRAQRYAQSANCSLRIRHPARYNSRPDTTRRVVFDESPSVEKIGASLINARAETRRPQSPLSALRSKAAGALLPLMAFTNGNAPVPGRIPHRIVVGEVRTILFRWPLGKLAQSSR